jgi:uncharacterized protein (DUF58 family)
VTSLSGKRADVSRRNRGEPTPTPDRKNRGASGIVLLDREHANLTPWILMILLAVVGSILLENRLLPAAAAVLISTLVAGWIWLRLSFQSVTYERSFVDAEGLRDVNHETRAFLGEEVELTLRVSNRKLLPLNWLRIADTLPAHLELKGAKVQVNRVTNQGELTSFWTLGAFETVERVFTIPCTQRGYAIYGPATLVTGDGFGIFTQRARLEQEHRLIIYPRLYSATELGLPAKDPFGEQSSDQLIFEDPLRHAGIRDWQPADGLRRVHWRASAKHQQLLSRIYEPSEEPQIQIILNVATLERHWEGVLEEKHELAVSVAGTLAHLATEARMPVGVMANGYLPGSDQEIRLRPGRSDSQLMSILELLAAVTPYASQPVETMLLRKAPTLPWGATLVVVTAVIYDGLLEALLELAHSRRRVLLFSLADAPPERPLPGIAIYHLTQLIGDALLVDRVAGARHPETPAL